jgi:hypothetical protein
VWFLEGSPGFCGTSSNPKRENSAVWAAVQIAVAARQEEKRILINLRRTDVTGAA